MAQITTRRSFLVSTASTLALVGGCSPGTDGSSETESVNAGPVEPEIELTEEDIELAEMIFTEFNQDPGNDQFTNTVAPFEGGGGRYDKIARAKRAIARDPEKRWFYWAEDDLDSFDYRHIVTMGATVTSDDGSTIETGLVQDPFELTTELLQKMMSANYFTHALDGALEENERAGNRVVVALRGAEIVEDGSGETGKIMLRETRPDHRNPLCTYIVWHRDPATETPLQVFKGSTVPSEMYLALFQSFDGNMYKSSMVPQGFHLRYVGNMNVGRSVHPNTLRQKSVCPVIREPDPRRSYFDVNSSQWDPSSSSASARSVGAHIHAGYWENKSERGWVWKFSSAGCQTICGSVANERKSGEIADFLSAMALPAAEPQDGVYTHEKYDTEFPLVILSGREARLHAQGAPLSAMRRIRFGSSVDGAANPDHPIVKFQEALGVTADGQFGAGSMLKLIEIQRAGTWQVGTAPDGIVTPELAATQSIELT